MAPSLGTTYYILCTIYLLTWILVNPSKYLPTTYYLPSTRGGVGKTSPHIILGWTWRWCWARTDLSEIDIGERSTLLHAHNLTLLPGMKTRWTILCKLLVLFLSTISSSPSLSSPLLSLTLIRRRTAAASSSNEDNSIAFDQFGGLPAVDEAYGFIRQCSPIGTVLHDSFFLLSWLMKPNILVHFYRGY